MNNNIHPHNMNWARFTLKKTCNKAEFKTITKQRKAHGTDTA